MLTRSKVIVLSGVSPLYAELKELLESRNYQVISLEQAESYQNQIEIALEVSNLDLNAKRLTIQKMDAALASHVPILATSMAVTATEIASWTLSPERVCGFGTFAPLSERNLIELAPALQTGTLTIEKAKTFIESLGKETAQVDDEVGLIFPRILSLIVNEAVFALMEGIAAPEDIDIAMRKGTNYPYGPLEWADRIGLDEVYSVVQGLHRDLAEERYRPAPLLRKLVLAGRIGKQSGHGFYQYEKQEGSSS
ncbi:3-hydroxyacyl-CoA dehydrogenase family protein [Paenibacillus sp. MZ04-78.2]|uniref:3-hydroxyacyl-CoA dehydrogenase family protein n=1 Tax=Paenibacillus sp. MZ04-78.2 TaxID=2962034 RepID=UPI0020B7243B|nr:3-hydroxyacyl-CoA dehydrogenase family protein [Paenibacillus sp. MZ04-78.2]MCP3772752.1 3-hydroxyacyl-CoA dehydrogenase family protein [Paenibacillus sp. MZ04-78.2]